MEKVKKVTLSGMLFAIGLILPFFIGQIPAVGKMLLPMHIPVLICGLILGWQYALVGAMISGRVVWAFAEVILLGMTGTMFTWEMFLEGAFLNAIPGIILQLVLIPVLMVALNKAKVVPFRRPEKGVETADARG